MIIPKWLVVIAPLVALLLGAGIALGIQRQIGIQNTEHIKTNTQSIKENSVTISQLQTTLTKMQTDVNWIRLTLEKFEEKESR